MLGSGYVCDPPMTATDQSGRGLNSAVNVIGANERQAICTLSVELLVKDNEGETGS